MKNKMLNTWEALNKKIILQSKPRSLFVTLTTRCNLRCIMCSFWEKSWDIPEKTLKEVILLFPYLQEVHWQGGEVFILDYFKDLFEQAAAFPNLKQSIITNGIFIDEDWLGRISRVRGCVSLDFSIDGVTKDTYEYVRRGARFEDLLKSILLVRRYKKELASKMRTTMNAVIMRSNLHQLESFIEFAHGYAFDQLQLSSIQGPSSQENIFFPKDKESLGYIEEKLRMITLKAKAYNIVLSICLPHSNNSQSVQKDQDLDESKSNRDNKDIICYLPWYSLFIHMCGRVYPHCLCRNQVGSIYESSLEEIWNNQAMQQHRRNIIDQTYEKLCFSDCISGVIPASIRNGLFDYLF